MTPAEVRQHRQAYRFGGADLYAAAGLARFVNRAAIEHQLVAECREIADILKHVPDFTEACGYGWAADPASYDVPSEVAFQRRVLLMLAKYWVETDPANRAGLPARLSGIIVLQEFITNFGLSSPRLRARRPTYRMLSVPAGFFELALWVFVGLRCWVATETGCGRNHGEDGGWSMVTTPVPPPAAAPFDHVTTYELMARTLAERGRDQALFGVNAALLIREQVPALAGEGGEVDVDRLPFFDQNATYMVAEFALAHELGHLLAGHDPNDTKAGMELASREAEADREACQLLAISSATRVFGWGEQIHDPWVQAAIGIALFDGFLTVKDALINGLLRRPGIATVGAALIAEEKMRAAIARHELTALLKRIARIGHGDDAGRVATLVDNTTAYMRDLRASVAAVPDDQVRLAIDIAKRSVDLRE